MKTIWAGKERFIESGLTVVGDRLRKPRIMRMGNPLTGEVEVGEDDSDAPGRVFLHGVGGDMLNLGASGEDDSTEDKKAVSQGLLPPGKIGKDLLVYGTQVEVVRKKGILHIVDIEGYQGNEHLYQINTRPQASIAISQFDYGLIRPTQPASMRVLVTESHPVLNGQAYFVPTRQSQSFVSYQPATAGKSVAVKLEIDPVTATLYYEAGSEFDTILSHSDAFSFYPNIVSDDRFLCGWVRASAGQVSVKVAHILHAHEVLNKDTGLTMAEIASRIVTAGGDVVTAGGDIVYVS